MKDFAITAFAVIWSVIGLGGIYDYVKEQIKGNS